MAEKIQRGNKEIRKAKKPKAAPAQGPSPFIVTSAKPGGGKKG